MPPPRRTVDVCNCQNTIRNSSHQPTAWINSAKRLCPIGVYYFHELTASAYYAKATMFEHSLKRLKEWRQLCLSTACSKNEAKVNLRRETICERKRDGLLAVFRHTICSAETVCDGDLIRLSLAKICSLVCPLRLSFRFYSMAV